MALVDDEDHEWLSTLTFQADVRARGTYAKTTLVVDGVRRKLSMHRMIMEWYCGPLGVQEVDHVNGNPLDNRKENLRLTGRCGNAQNVRRKLAKDSSLYKGVFKEGETYRAMIRHGETLHHLGHYPAERDAAIAYNLRARELFGTFAHLNDVNATLEEEARVRAWMNDAKRRVGSSRYRGVSLSHGTAWRATIHINGKSVKLGSFSTEEAAALAYNEAALKHWGDKARLNVISSSSPSP